MFVRSKFTNFILYDEVILCSGYGNIITQMGFSLMKSIFLKISNNRPAELRLQNVWQKTISLISLSVDVEKFKFKWTKPYKYGGGA